MTVTPPPPLDAPRLRDALRVAERWLALNREHLNAINVYPVPDGDTGTNMLLTVRAALQAAEGAAGGAVGEYMRAVARGALMGARGNSGVILSQMLRGFAEAIEGADVLDDQALCLALGNASRVAYAAVPHPVEGTMLTVMREAAEAATPAGATSASGPAAMAAALTAAVEAARSSVSRTPQLLPRLAEAGVVDAGGLGIEVLLTGLRCGCLGEELPAAPAAPEGAVELSAVEHEGHGYCTEYVLVGVGLDRAAIERALAKLGGDSILVVGDAEALHVHVHLADPGPALSAGVALGALQSVKVDNMQAQHEQWAAGHQAATGAAPASLPDVGLVAVAQGAGIAAAFRDLGATQVVDGGREEKPSAGELLDAARRAGSRHVFLLPNDPNVIMAAEQAAAEAGTLITVVPSRSVVEGLNAAVAYNPEGELAATAERMRRACGEVHTVEVTYAVRDTTADGVRVSAGDAIALVDGVLRACAADLEGALLAGLERVLEAAELVTLYLGADAPPGATESVVALLGNAHPDLPVEVIEGGQPYYPYVLGVE